MSLPRNWICTKAARRLEIFSVYSFSSSAPSVILVVTMVGSFAPKRLFSKLYRFVRKKLELNSVPRSSKNQQVSVAGNLEQGLLLAAGVGAEM